MLKLDETFEFLGDLDVHPIEIISGMADGADTLGIKYAKEHKLTMVLYPANWDKYPRMAGILRNMNMLVTATHLVAFSVFSHQQHATQCNRDEMNPAHTNGKEWNSHHG